MAEYGIYQNTETGKSHLACEQYSVPAHVQKYVDLITPTIRFDATIKQKKKRRSIESRGLSIKPVLQVMPNPLAADAAAVTFTLANCYEYTTPDCLRSLYNFNNGLFAL